MEHGRTKAICVICGQLRIIYSKVHYEELRGSLISGELILNFNQRGLHF